MKKIGILYIVTGEYWKFWQNFYESSEKYFLKDCELHYFIFTDSNFLLKKSNDKIHTFYMKQREWPFPTLLRYETFFEKQSSYIEMDYLIFCNSNIMFTKPITFLNLFEDKDLFATLHPGHAKKNYHQLPFERNENSLASFKVSKSSKYLCGGFNGGTRESFLQLIETLMLNINTDLQNNVIAKWHDESHINSYINKQIDKFNILDVSYCYPENRRLNVEKKVLIRDKDKVISIQHKGILYAIRYQLIKIIRNTINYIKDVL